MYRRLTLATLPLALTAIVLAGCATTPTATSPSAAASAGSSATTNAASDDSTASSTSDDGNADVTVVRDDEWSASDAQELSVGSGDITITKAGVYRLSGDVTGSVIIAAPDDAQVVLMLDGAHITSTDGAAIRVDSADDVALNLVAGSENSVSDGGTVTADDEANAAIYADTDLTISGSGALTVTATGNDGITSTDDLAVIGGTISVSAADDALRGKDAVQIEDGTITADAGGRCRAQRSRRRRHSRIRSHRRRHPSPRGRR